MDMSTRSDSTAVAAVAAVATMMVVMMEEVEEIITALEGEMVSQCRRIPPPEIVPVWCGGRTITQTYTMAVRLSGCHCQLPTGESCRWRLHRPVTGLSV